MSITKTTFTGTTLADQAPQVLAWLQANAADYFDTITYDDSTSTIVCSVDNNVAMVLDFSTTSSAKAAKLYLANSASVELYRSGTSVLFNYGVATDHGIAINIAYPTTVNGSWIFLTKSDTDSLIMVAMGATSANVGNTHLWAGDYAHSGWADYFGAESTGDLWGELLSVSASLTTLVPIAIRGYPSYTPNLFIMRFSQYVGVEGVITINGTEYYSNGYLALKG